MTAKLSKNSNDFSLIILKPDAMQKKIVGDVLSFLLMEGLELVAAKVTHVSRELAEEHYINIRQKPFFDGTIRFLLGEFNDNAPVMALVIQGPGVIEKIRDICGHTDPEKAHPDSIRGRFGRVTPAGVFENVIHASSSLEDAEREVKLWFTPDEIVTNAYPSKSEMLSVARQTWK